MTLRYRQLDANGDYTVGLPFLVDSVDAVAQLISTRLKLWAGEYFVDLSEGTPYEAEVLGKRSGKQPEAAIRQRILQTTGVTSLERFTSEFDPDSRRLTVNATVNTLFGQVAIDEAL